MFDSLRGSGSKSRLGAVRRHPLDPLLKPIVMDLLITTCGFALMVAAVVLAVQGLPLN